MANTLSQVPVRYINNPQSQVQRSDRALSDIQGIFERPTLLEPETPNTTPKAAKKLRYQKLESRPSWRALKSVYWILAVLLTIAEGGHTYLMAVTVGVNPLMAAATAVCLYTGLSILFYFLFRRLSAYVAFGSRK